MSTEGLSKAAQAAWSAVTKLANGPTGPISAVSVVLKENARIVDGVPTIVKNSRSLDPL